MKVDFINLLITLNSAYSIYDMTHVNKKRVNTKGSMWRGIQIRTKQKHCDALSEFTSSIAFNCVQLSLDFIFASNILFDAE